MTSISNRTSTTKRRAGKPAAQRKSAGNAPIKTPTRVGLSTELIVDTACELIAESHTEQLTMRRLSERLGVALGATYHYVPDRDSLLALVAERINGQTTLRSTRPSDWASTLRTLLIDYADAYRKYPGMASFVNAHIGATRVDETQRGLAELLTAAGFSPKTASNVLAACYFYTSGAAAREILDHDQSGYTAALLRQRFEDGLDIILDGARVQLRADKRARRSGGDR